MSQKLGILVAKENSADLSVLRELLEAGQVTPAIDRSFAVGETTAAVRYFAEGRTRGKAVISL